MELREPAPDYCDIDEWFEERWRQKRSLPSDSDIDPGTLRVTPVNLDTFTSLIAPQLRDILALLGDGPRTVNELAQAKARRPDAVARDVERLDWMGLVHTVPLDSSMGRFNCLVGKARPNIVVETGELLDTPAKCLGQEHG